MKEIIKNEAILESTSGGNLSFYILFLSMKSKNSTI